MNGTANYFAYVTIQDTQGSGIRGMTPQLIVLMSQYRIHREAALEEWQIKFILKWKVRESERRLTKMSIVVHNRKDTDSMGRESGLFVSSCQPLSELGVE